MASSCFRYATKVASVPDMAFWCRMANFYNFP